MDESFEDDRREWLASIPEDFRDIGTIADGTLRFTTRPQQARMIGAEPTQPVNEDITGDQRLEVMATLDPGATAVIGCRNSTRDDEDPRSIEFFLTSGGEAGLYQVPQSAMVSGDEIRLANLITLDSVPEGSVPIQPGAHHELALECIGGGAAGPVEVTAFVDGAEVLSGEALDHVATGGTSVGFYHADYGNLPPGEPPISVTFDQARFFDLAQEPSTDFGGPTVVDESFDDDSLGWIEGILQTSIRSIDIADGALTFDVGPEGGSAIVATVERPVDDIIGDQRIEVSASLSETASIQLHCRSSNGDRREVRWVVDSDRSLHLLRLPAQGQGATIGDYVELEDVVGESSVSLTEEPTDFALECLDSDEGMVAIGYLNGDEVIRGIDPDPVPRGFGAVGVGSLGSDGMSAIDGGYEVKVHEYRMIDLSK
jgi:hypothetical protein